MAVDVLFLIILISYSSSSSLSQSPVSCSGDNIACVNHVNTTLDSVTGVETVEECRQLCQDNDECQFLTYYDQNSLPYHNNCFLLRYLLISHIFQW